MPDDWAATCSSYFQKSFENIEQQHSLWKIAVSSAGEILMSLWKISEVYECALSVDILDTPLHVHPDLDRLTKVKKIAAISGKLDELYNVVSDVKEICENVEKQWSSCVTWTQSQECQVEGISPVSFLLTTSLLLLDKINRHMQTDYAIRLYYLQRISSEEAKVDVLSWIIPLWDDTRVLDALVTEASFHQHAG